MKFDWYLLSKELKPSKFVTTMSNYYANFKLDLILNVPQLLWRTKFYEFSYSEQ